MNSLEVLHRFPEGMHQDAAHLLGTVRMWYPKVHFWIDPDPLIPRTKDEEGKLGPIIRRAVFALTPPDVQRQDLSPVTDIFNVAYERYLWRKHAREIGVIQDVVTRLLWGAAGDRDRLLGERG